MSHCPSQIACARALYSASDDDLETTDCFLLFQLIREVPRKKHMPDVDLLVSGHAPQSESEKPLSFSEEEELKNNP
ncbi:putative mitochondrial protein [Trifolium repens]|nr:putative mitochondrial protein [Trifolium repens]